MRQSVLIPLLILIAVTGGFVLGRATDEPTTYNVKKVVVQERPAGSSRDRLRGEFGLPTAEESCDEFGIPNDICPGSTP